MARITGTCPGISTYEFKGEIMLKIIATAGLASVLLLTGCDFENVEAGPLQTSTRTIERDKTELVRADLRMGAGELTVRGGAEKMLEAEFHYNVPDWRPEVRYSATG